MSQLDSKTESTYAHTAEPHCNSASPCAADFSLRFKKLSSPGSSRSSREQHRRYFLNPVLSPDKSTSRHPKTPENPQKNSSQDALVFHVCDLRFRGQPGINPPFLRFPFVIPCQPFKLSGMGERVALIKRSTKETRIELKLEVDGIGKSAISTRIPFFDHMLTLFAKHAVMDLKLKCKGDLEVDAHHTVEDCGIALGQAFREALGDKAGIRRYGTGFNEAGSAEAELHRGTGVGRGRTASQLDSSTVLKFNRGVLKGEAYVPMDECLARCVIDFSGRPYLVWRGLDQLAYKQVTAKEKRQDMSSAFRFGLAREFFQGFTNEARCNLHLELLYGDEPHHVVEGLFKAFAKATDFACQRDPRIAGQIPSTKGKL